MTTTFTPPENRRRCMCENGLYLQLCQTCVGFRCGGAVRPRGDLVRPLRSSHQRLPVQRQRRPALCPAAPHPRTLPRVCLVLNTPYWGTRGSLRWGSWPQSSRRRSHASAVVWVRRRVGCLSSLSPPCAPLARSPALVKQCVS